jgi:uncharacterized protein
MYREKVFSVSAGSCPPVFHVMIKPQGPICNLECSYCFYREKDQLYPDEKDFRMSHDVLEEFTRQYIQSQEVPEVVFSWQGGEPTLMGIAFFRRAVELQNKYKRPGMRVLNAFQTNGTLLDDEWCIFFREHDFLVGISLDGPEELHDKYRCHRGGGPTFSEVIRGLHLLQGHGVEYNVLTVVNRVNGRYHRQVYNFLKEEGVKFMQFIPAVAEEAPGMVTPWTVEPRVYGHFLCGIFDEWVRHDVGEIFVQLFDVLLGAWLGMRPALCIFSPTCGDALAMEHNGDLYSCDHFVSCKNLLGNILDTPMGDLVGSQFQRDFGRDKYKGLPNLCRKCDFLFACHGACPKDRFVKTPDGEGGLNYLCPGYKLFFEHVAPYMRIMAREVRAGRPARIIMEMLSRRSKKVGRNESCPCGSGRKYKNCCLKREL